MQLDLWLQPGTAFDEIQCDSEGMTLGQPASDLQPFMQQPLPHNLLEFPWNLNFSA